MPVGGPRPGTRLRPEWVEALVTLPITTLALDAVPQISRAQSMEVLSSMANIAGSRAVIEAAREFALLFTEQVTSAGIPGLLVTGQADTRKVCGKVFPWLAGYLRRHPANLGAALAKLDKHDSGSGHDADPGRIRQ